MSAAGADETDPENEDESLMSASGGADRSFPRVRAGKIIIADLCQQLVNMFLAGISAWVIEPFPAPRVWHWIWEDYRSR
jgi:hypothetical protein